MFLKNIILIALVKDFTILYLSCVSVPILTIPNILCIINFERRRPESEEYVIHCRVLCWITFFFNHLLPHVAYIINKQTGKMLFLCFNL